MSGVSKLLGFGAYTTADAERILASKVPSMNATLDQGVRIAHHEYLADVTSSTGFATKTYPINPGLETTFPWLSTVASAFQEYEINGLIFFFKATSSNALNSTNTALGQIIGAVQYNPYLAAPGSKVEMLGLSSASDGKPSESNIYPVECKADMTLFRSKLVRWSGVTDDLAKYDHGNFFLGANGSQYASVVGELHVVYDILLKKPKLWSTVSPAWFTHVVSSTSVATATPLGTSWSIVKGNLGVNLTSNTISIQPAYVVPNTKYQIIVVWSGANVVTAVVPTLGLVNASGATADYYNNGAYSNVQVAPENAGSGKQVMLRHMFVTVAGNTETIVSFGLGGTIPTGGTPSVDIILSECL